MPGVRSISTRLTAPPAVEVGVLSRRGILSHERHGNLIWVVVDAAKFSIVSKLVAGILGIDWSIWLSGGLAERVGSVHCRSSKESGVSRV